MNHKGQTVKVLVEKPSMSSIAAHSATLSHLRAYSHVLQASRVLSQTASLLGGMFVTFFSLLSLVKGYVVDSPSSPALFKVAYGYLAEGAKKVDATVNQLLLSDGIDAFILQYVLHNGSLGMWTAYFALDYTANVSNYLIRGLVLKPLQLVRDGDETSSAAAGRFAAVGATRGANGSGGAANGDYAAGGYSTPSSQADSVKLSSVGSELPHVRELSNTTTALRRDISDKYIAPTKTMIESYLEPTKTKIEAQYIHPINERVESTKNLINNKYDEFVKPTYEAAYETVSKAYEGRLNSFESVPRAIVSTGVDLGSRTFEKIKSVTLHNEGSVSTAELTAVADEVIVNGVNENEEIAAA
ncbi:Pln1p Ecym_5222 [Eremothecium cymbalariae DBVPG|uniref:Uncharacterized protein n=1 Tax=Eremothecium cymbalariae (strain CBS 270.75 / DBVPG 7215 / KCTC 17166 / NRRL Y-17582) TaxID=931890 RepID=I6ND48_ERECY|nr:hypothetical protein Ecym_5222 [Eremothecium cymbalariae DBVPG\